ncbi:MAG: 50S ribosomal protein L18 [Saprospiraceae bacterium]|nr:50S ribosomal protein L18 [Saprospiraceae bacterium]
MSTKILNRRKKVHKRIRKTLAGTATKPRLSVFRSNKGIYAQIVDDSSQSTIVAASYKEIEGKTKIEQANAVGQLIATKAMQAGITHVVFDRSGYLYHGRVKALAEGARGAQNEDGTNELLQF